MNEPSIGLAKNFVHRTAIISPGMGGQSSLLAAAIGDWTWDVCHQLCGIDVYNAKNKNGQPSYFSFFYYHISGSENIHFKYFNIGHEVDVFSMAYACSEESLHTIHQIRLIVPGKKIIHQASIEDIFNNPDPDCLYVETFNRWVSRVNEGSNEKLEKAAPVGFTYKHLPQLPTAYAPWLIYKKAMQEKKFTFPQFENYEEILDKNFNSVDYKIDPNKDVNGVGLLYFASYFSIFDHTFLEVWNRLQGEEQAFFSRKVLNQKICYLGNADYKTPLKIVTKVFRNRDNKFDYVFNFEMYRENDNENIAICTLHALIEDSLEEKLVDLKSFQNDLRNDLAEVLKKSSTTFDLKSEFFKIGLTSVLIVEFAQLLIDKYDSNIEQGDLIDYPTLEQVSSYWMEKLPTLRKRYRKKVGEFKQPEKVKTIEAKKPITDNLDVAIIGISARFPDAKNKELFWKNLVNNKNAISEIPIERWDVNSVDAKVGMSVSRWAGLVNDMDMFDSAFFKISPKEAELMDPQQRVMLEESWNCFEDAGYTTTKLKNSKTAVYIASFGSDYAEISAKNNSQPEEHSSIGLSPSVLANRISYFFDLTGPSLVIDTACSGSIVALEQAILSLRAGKCDQALVGAVNGLFSPSNFITFSKAGMLSADGFCKTFDDSANGYVRSEGCAAILVKPLDQAIADGDTIYGVVKAVSVNHGGHSFSLTAPNSNAQAELIINSFKEAKLAPDTISYVEAHGTGTSLGDPIEVKGLTKAFNTQSNLKPNSCALGSVKSNIGHLESVAGLAGIIKVLLSMKHKLLPANLHFKNLNKTIDLTEGPFFILDKNREWQASNPLRASVSSFGSGGTNAHTILEEFVKQDHYVEKTDEEYVFILSAKSEERLLEHVKNIRNFVQENRNDFKLSQLAYTLQTAREEMEDRLGFVAKSVDEFIAKVESYLGDKSGVYSGNIKKENSAFRSLLESREGGKFIESYFKVGKYDEIVHLWVLGVQIDWAVFWKSHPHKISLPNYPFERKRYWLEKGKIETVANRQSYQYEFDGSEFFLRDHCVNESSVLPGVAYLEMVKSAGEKLFKKSIKTIYDVAWLKPVVYQGNESIKLNVEFNNQMAFKIHSVDGTVNCEGRFGFENTNTNLVLNIKEIISRTSKKILRKDIYEKYKARGLLYKETFQALSEILVGEDECLAKIEIPKSLLATFNNFSLHPTLFDAALQATLGLTGEQIATNLPFALKSLTIHNHAGAIELVYIKNVLSNNNIKKFDLFLLDSSGNVGFTLKDFVLREMKSQLINPSNDKSLKEKLKDDLIHIICDVVKVNSQELDSDEDMSAYGFDSILATKFIGSINEKFELALNPATFFEYPTVNSLVDFILDEHKSLLTNKYGKTVPPQNSSQNIAVIGMSGLFPGSKNLSEYWDNLENRRDLIGQGPWERGLSNYQGGFVEDIDKFDAAFFNISPKEAELMDPQHRLFLQTVWSALEDAGISKSKISKSKTAVYAGISTYDYQTLLIKNGLTSGAYSATGINHALLSNRVSYLLNLNGPSESIDTACSSSLVAIHRAANSLLIGEADLAIAGGVNGLLATELFESFGDAGMLSKDSRCKTFDERANGYVRGEGAGVVILKTLATALADGDRIHAVIKSTAVNHGGNVSSLTVPNPNAQAELITEAINRAQIDPRTLGYIETHGTGTSLGDPIEINGLKKAFNEFNVSEKGFCHLGAVKANIGHLEAAAGMAGILKTILAFKNRKIPGQVNFTKLNPYIEIVETPFVINVETSEWRKRDDNTPRRAGVSSFGFGGTNAHIILEEYTVEDNYQENGNSDYLLPFSARSEERVLEQVTNLLNFLKINSRIKLSSIAYTLQNGREEMNYRLAIVAKTRDELIKKLNSGVGVYKGIVRKERNSVLVENESLENIAQKWVLGAEVAWSSFWSGVKPQITSLPSYPFEKVRYWIPENKVSELVSMETSDSLKEATSKYLATILASEIKIDEKKLRVAEDLSGFGIDSIVINKAIATLEIEFPALPKTLLFEYTSINSLADYFINNYHAALTNKFMFTNSSQVKPQAKSAISKQNINKSDNDIAVIGISGRYPDADNLDEFWTNLKLGRDSVREIPVERWDSSLYRSYSKWGGFIADADKFDPLFFGISPSEAEIMDPQQRVLLEQVWIALEDAGYAHSRLNKKVGVFVGAMWNDYQTVGVEAATVVSANYWQIANRISYHFNFNGPSLVVDTACSSSLSAIHLATESLKRGECTTAIVCGVNLSIHPVKYTTLCETGFASTDGKCRSFGEGGDGYVPGEGVGVVVLKRFEDALIDTDYIYCKIKGSFLNHGGRTNGFTVPNPNAQSELILNTLNLSDVDPRTLSFVEAHGTGTSLGDPIEIAGLTNAFKQHTSDLQFCSIGSLKSNIGHLEAAAGVAGLTKAIFQLQYKKLVPSLHSQRINPYIDFSKTPFYLQHDLAELKSTNGTLRGSVSSFGAGGSNAHVILEAFENIDQFQANIDQEYLFVLSAKKVERLKVHVKNILAYLKSNNKDFSLARLAYTLQCGREAMSERLAFVARSLEQVISKLEEYLNGSKLKIVQAGKLEKIAEGWVRGEEVDWNQFWTNGKPLRLRVPFYPFERKRYWVANEPKRKWYDQKIHPLVHINTSNFESQRFSSEFLGNEFFLRDHILESKKTLPGVAYLEMALIAGELSSAKEIRKISDIVWLAPAVWSENRSLKIEVNLTTVNDQILFEIYSLVDKTAEREVHCQGKMSSATYEVVSSFNIAEITERLSSKILNKVDIYKIFKSRGLEYKESFQGLEKIFIGEDECLAKLRLPDSLSGFKLHPGIFDAALQSIVSLLNDQGTYLPFALKEVLLGQYPGEIEAVYVKRVIGNSSVKKFDLFLLNQKGEVQAHLKDFVVRELKLVEKPKNRIIYLQPQWSESPLELDSFGDIDPMVYLGEKSALFESLNREKLLLDSFTYYKDFSIKFEQTPKTVLVNWFNLNDSMEVAIEKSYNALVEVIQKLMLLKAKDKISILVLAPNKPIFGAISGLAKTLKQENPKYQLKLVLSNQEITLENLKLELNEINTLEVRYANNKREVRRIVEFVPINSLSKIKRGGTYLITGGLGGLGKVFTKYLQNKYQAKVYLTGRSALTERQREELNGVNYIQADVANFNDCERVRKQIAQLDGIIHSAGVLRDSFILKKKISEAKVVIAPKVYGTDNLLKLFKNEVDFILCFSSSSGLLGNAGQSDYSFSNSFMDYLAETEEKIYSVNWPLWKEGGMQVDTAIEEYLKKTTGMNALSNEDGIEVLEKILTLEHKQLLGVTGDKPKIIKYAGVEPAKDKTTLVVTDELQTKTEIELLKICSELLKVENADLDINEELIEYGVDSIMMMKILNKVEEHYKNSVPASAIAESLNIKKFAAYLINEGIVSNVAVEKNSKHEPKNRFEISKVNKGNKVAVIGMACRFPESDSLEAFWNNLKNGVELIGEVPDDRWSVDKYFNSNRDSKEYTSYSKWGGFIDSVYDFDARFFGIEEKDALIMDPQHRVLLEVAQELFDRAGYAKEKLSGSKTGIYVGAAESNYVKNNLDKIPNDFMNHLMVNSIQNMMAARISDFYNLKGESFTIDTACSSSLVAIHQACQSIINGHNQMAIAGGIEMLLDERCHVGFSKGQVLSDEPHSYIFDERAKGFILGEGVGLVLLKDYEQAKKDNDTILGVILGSAVNNDGKTMGLTVPNQDGQKEVIKAAINKAQIDPSTITLYEAHGTGTLLGDPIEVRAATQIYQDFTSEKQYCAIGSVKSNIGHTLHAAGVASFIKIVLSLLNREIPATINCEKPHPRFKFEESPFYPVTKSTNWNPACQIRRAAISSFGFGGTNCHLILEESDKVEPVEISLTKFESAYYNLAKDYNDLLVEFEEAQTIILAEINKGKISRASGETFINKLRKKYRINSNLLFEKGVSSEERH